MRSPAPVFYWRLSRTQRGMVTPLRERVRFTLRCTWHELLVVTGRREA
jgi:hypothetical protein